MARPRQKDIPIPARPRAHTPLGEAVSPTVEIAWIASHGSPSDPIGQRKARSLSASPAFAGRSNAELAAFGRVDTK